MKNEMNDKLLFSFYTKNENNSLEIKLKIHNHKNKLLVNSNYNEYTSEDFLREIKDKDTYEFPDTDCIISKNNILKISFCLENILTRYLTDNIIGNITKEEKEEYFSKIDSEIQ